MPDWTKGDEPSPSSQRTRQQGAHPGRCCERHRRLVTSQFQQGPHRAEVQCCRAGPSGGSRGPTFLVCGPVRPPQSQQRQVVFSLLIALPMTEPPSSPSRRTFTGTYDPQVTRDDLCT